MRTLSDLVHARSLVQIKLPAPRFKKSRHGEFSDAGAVLNLRYRTPPIMSKVVAAPLVVELTSTAMEFLPCLRSEAGISMTSGGAGSAEVHSAGSEFSAGTANGSMGAALLMTVPLAGASAMRLGSAGVGSSATFNRIQQGRRPALPYPWARRVRGGVLTC